jgi:hypothetical protein
VNDLAPAVLGRCAKLLAGSVNPVRETNPASLGKLFADDPLGLANVDLSLRAAQLRRERLSWAIAAKLEANRAIAAKLAVAAERQALRDAAKAGGQLALPMEANR